MCANYVRKVGRPRKGYSKGGKKLGRPRKVTARNWQIPKKPTVDEKIKRAIAKNVENKQVTYLGTGMDIMASNNSSFDLNIIPCYPSAGFLVIPQGTGQGNRIGNRIKIKNLSIKGVVFPLQYNAVTNPTPAPVHIKFWFFYDKEEPQTVPTPVASGDFFQSGSTTIGFQNELFDHYMPVNLDRYRLLTTRIMKIGYASYTGTGALPQQGNLANNDYSLNCSLLVNLTKHCVKNCVFRDTASTPTTRGIYMMAQAVYANGAPIAVGTVPARLEYIMQCDYEDA